MKRMLIAIILNIFLPGVGFIYLKKPTLIIAGVIYILYTIGMINMASKYIVDFITPFLFSQLVIVLLTYEIAKSGVPKEEDEKEGIFKEEKYLLCKKCGKKNLIDSIYCEFCGAKIDEG